jgi:hypothetical protein
MTTLNRRALVTGAAALVPAPAVCGPVMHPDAELLDIGEQIKKRLPDYYKARQISHALYEHTRYATGLSLLGDISASEKWERLLTRADIPMRLTEQMSSICPYMSSPSAQAISHYGRRKERPLRQWPRLWRWIV